MTEAVTISIVAGVASVVSAYFAYRAKAVAMSTHLAVNSRMDEFKRIAERLFHAEGKAEGIAEVKSVSEKQLARSLNKTVRRKQK